VQAEKFLNPRQRKKIVAHRRRTPQRKSLFMFLNLNERKPTMKVALSLLFIASHAVLSLQKNYGEKTEQKFTIDNCVNEFSIAKVESTKVGYQYWFVDKDFLDGRTLKMSEKQSLSGRMARPKPTLA
jgi:hypothetical protein